MKTGDVVIYTDKDGHIEIEVLAKIVKVDGERATLAALPGEPRTEFNDGDEFTKKLKELKPHIRKGLENAK